MSLRISCQKCGADISAADVDFKRNIAKCDACGEIFNCAEDLSGSASYSQEKLQEVPLPKGFSIGVDEKGLLITRKWFSLAVIFLTVFCLFWDGFMVMWYTIAITQKQWIMAAFGSIHAAVGIGLRYFTLCLYVNRTYIRAGQGFLSVRHGPLPIGKPKEFEAYRIRNLYIKRKTSRNDGSSCTSYEVCVKIQDKKDQSLVKNLIEKNQALYIEQQVEQFS